MIYILADKYKIAVEYARKHGLGPGEMQYISSPHAIRGLRGFRYAVAGGPEGRDDYFEIMDEIKLREAVQVFPPEFSE